MRDFQSCRNPTRAALKSECWGETGFGSQTNHSVSSGDGWKIVGYDDLESMVRLTLILRPTSSTKSTSDIHSYEVAGAPAFYYCGIT